MNRIALLAAVALAAGLAGAARAAPVLHDMPLGLNAENQACRVQVRFNGSAPGRSVDIYCGQWERPSGSLYVLDAKDAAKAQTLLAEDCAGEGKPLSVAGLTDARQVFCAGGENRRLGLTAQRGALRVTGFAYPADWAPLLRAAEAMTGAVDPRSFAAESAKASGPQTPGLAEIRAVYPDGAPGQGAEFNYALLRRRAYENNVVWSFGSAERDFSELLRNHRIVAPEDAAGEAELLMELGLNLSDNRRFDDAADIFAQAEAKLGPKGDLLLLSKLDNYRAIDALNQNQPAKVQAFARAGAAKRAQLEKAEPGSGAFRIPATVAGGLNGARGLVVGEQAGDQAEKETVLAAQGWWLMGVAAGALRQPDADADLAEASRRLDGARNPPAWLLAQIDTERARQRLARSDVGGASVAVEAGLQRVRASSPGSRAEAHLLLLKAQVELAAGRPDGERKAGRDAMTIFAAQRETPGMPADVAAAHLSALLAAWTARPDAATAAEYFETLALVWDGAAARSAAQLAARVGSGEAAGQARTFQDAERRYRAAQAVRQRVGTKTSPDPDELRAADKEVDASVKALAQAESALRAASPRYLELLKPGVTAKDLQSVLQPEEGYLRIVMATGGGFGALVTRDGVTPYAIPLTAARAETLTAKLRKSTQYHGGRLADFDLASAEALDKAIVGPLAAPMRGLKRLQIDAPGALAAAPFAALVDAAPSAEMQAKIDEAQDYTGVAWLARRVTVASAVGPGSFISLRRQKRPEEPLRFAAFGNFTPAPKLAAERLTLERTLSPRCTGEVQQALQRLPALPDTAQEAQKAAALFGGAATLRLGPEFTDASFLDDKAAQDASVILLATHGVLGLSPCFAEPALLTSVGPKGSGLIEASELLDRRFEARLVIMSACDTAGGAKLDAARTGLTDGGEALSGLARAFLYAGASSVLATQWKVDAATSGQQVQVMLSAALRGDDLADALAEAQRKAFDNPETAHPFYWAAFTLIGDGGATLPGRGVPTQRAAVEAAAPAHSPS